MTSIVPKRSALPSLGDLRKGMATTASTITTSSMSDLLRLTNGRWVYGQQNTEVESGSLWAVNVHAIEKGFVAWTDRPKGNKNEIKGERMVPVTAEMPSELPEMLDDKNNNEPVTWSEQYKMELVCCTGQDKKTQVTYKTNSVGGLRVVQDILDQIIAQLDAEDGKDEAEQAIVPILELETDSYMHTTYGETFVPVFTVVGWTTFDGMVTVEEDFAETGAPGEEQIEEQKAAAPARRRRRS